MKPRCIRVSTEEADTQHAQQMVSSGRGSIRVVQSDLPPAPTLGPRRVRVDTSAVPKSSESAVNMQCCNGRVIVPREPVQSHDESYTDLDVASCHYDDRYDRAESADTQNLFRRSTQQTHRTPYKAKEAKEALPKRVKKSKYFEKPATTSDEEEMVDMSKFTYPVYESAIKQQDIDEMSEMTESESEFHVELRNENIKDNRLTICHTRIAENRYEMLKKHPRPDKDNLIFMDD